MKSARSVLLLLGIVAITWLPEARAENLQVTMNLASQEAGSTRVESMSPDRPFTVKITNRLPVGYTVVVERRPISIPPLEFGAGPPGEPPPACDSLILDLEKALEKAKTEQDVAREVRLARDRGTSCPAAKQESLEITIVDATVKILGPYDALNLGEEFLVTVSRGSGESAKQWTLTLTTGPAGEWRVTYGFNFVPDEDERYFLRPRDDGKFDIREERGDGDFTFVPTIFASWLSRKQQFRGFGWGLSGGLGFDSSKPIVFAGPTFTYRENVSLNLGLVMQQRQRLNARLDPAEPVAENLGDDQLHRTDGYRPNWFIGIGFRFKDNPFKATEKDSTPEREE